MKKIITKILIAVVLVMSLFHLNITVNAVKILTDVPPSYNVLVTYNEGGDVLIVNSRLIASGTTVSIKRFEQQEYTIRTKSGYDISKVTYNGANVTNSVICGKFLAPKITCDSTLTIEYKKVEIKTPTCVFTLVGMITLNGKPLENVLLNLENPNSTTKTNNDGKYRFNKIPAGDNSITVFVNGKPVGYAKFTFMLDNINMASYTKLSDGTIEITINQDMKYIQLDLNINGNGIISPVKVVNINDKDVKNYPMPKTGDKGILLNGIMLIVSLFLILLILIIKRKLKKKIKP